MKKVFLCVCVALFAVTSMAQQQRQRRAVEYPSQDMITTVKLTAEEVTKLKANEETYTAALQKAMQDAGQDFEKMQTAMKAARALRLYGIKQILAADKYQTYLEYEVVNPSFGGFAGRQRTTGTGGQRQGGGGNFGGGNNNSGGGNDNFGGGNDDF